MNADERQILRDAGISEKELDRIDRALAQGAKPDWVMVALAVGFWIACLVWCTTIGW